MSTWALRGFTFCKPCLGNKAPMGMLTSFAGQGFAVQTLKNWGRPGAHALRAMPVRFNCMSEWGRGPMAVLLPCEGRRGASLLRMYRVAQGLRPLGWRTVVLPASLTLSQRHRFISELSPDVLVMQGSRHALNRPALYPGQRIVYDMDDADFHLPHLADPVRRAMPEVGAVIAGSRYIADWCLAAGAARADVIWTGSPVSGGPRVSQSRRSPVIAWAQSRPATYVREADWVLEVMRRLSQRIGKITLRLYDRQPGDDLGFAARFEEAGVSVEWRRTLRYSDYLASFDDVAVGLAPLCPETPFSRGKSFGKVLAYLDRKVPVVGSDAGEHGCFFTPSTGVISNDFDHWVREIGRLVGDNNARQKMADAAFEDFRVRLTDTVAAKQADLALRMAIMDRL